MDNNALYLSIAGVALIVPRVRRPSLLDKQEGCRCLSFLCHHRDPASRWVVADDLRTNTFYNIYFQFPSINGILAFISGWVYLEQFFLVNILK